MCAEKIGIRGRRSFEMLVCIMLRSRVRLRLLCGLYVFAVNAHTCVWQKQGPRGHPLADTCLLCLGPFRVIVHTHVCCINKEPVVTIFCVDVSANTVVLQNASLLSGIIPFDCAHACVLQKPGIGGRSWHLRCLRMFISMSMRVHVLADRQAIGCHGSCDGVCADVFRNQGVRCRGFFCGACVLHSWSRLLVGSIVLA